MQSCDIDIINKLGLHARAAAKLVKLCGEFSSEIRIGRPGQMVNGKSIMGIMMLAASQGSERVLRADGCDEGEAMQALVDLINNRFGEDE